MIRMRKWESRKVDENCPLYFFFLHREIVVIQTQGLEYYQQVQYNPFPPKEERKELKMEKRREHRRERMGTPKGNRKQPRRDILSVEIFIKHKVVSSADRQERQQKTPCYWCQYNSIVEIAAILNHVYGRGHLTSHSFTVLIPITHVK